MLSKEILGGGEVSELPYTHILQSVDINSLEIGFIETNPQSSLIPNTLNDFSVSLVAFQISTDIFITLSSSIIHEYPQELYLGFTYNKLWSDIYYDSNYTTNPIKRYYYTKSLDTSSQQIDFRNTFALSKETPQKIWLSTTPPPWI